MNSALFHANWKDVGSAVLSAVIVSVLSLVGNSTNIFALDWSQIANVAFLTAMASFVKALGTSSETGKTFGIPLK